MSEWSELARKRYKKIGEFESLAVKALVYGLAFIRTTLAGHKQVQFSI
jgi:hypothetical protein